MTKRGVLDRRAVPTVLFLLSCAACSSEGPAIQKKAAEASVDSAAASARHAGGQAFDKEVRLLFRFAACAGDEPVPSNLAATVETHCKALKPYVDTYRKKYLERAQAFLVALQPKGLPTAIVYFFGGGDLLSALTTYPNLTEITTVSLEHAGDPRRIAGIEAQGLEDNLLRLRRGISGLLAQSDSTSENLMQLQRGKIPGQLAFFLIGLAIHNQEPVSLRYFRIEADGSLHYLEEAEIATIEGRTAKRLNSKWESPDFSVAFSNMELTFKPARAVGGTVRVHRHIAANLMDGPLGSDPRVLEHLETKGRITAMTKAASYTLWNEHFSKIRNYLLRNMEFMISDSTGIPPRYAKRAGFVQETYGTYKGPYLEASTKDSDDFQSLWQSQPQRALPFRYGYLDAARNVHLLVTRRPDKQP